MNWTQWDDENLRVWNVIRAYLDGVDGVDLALVLAVMERRRVVGQ